MAFTTLPPGAMRAMERYIGRLEQELKEADTEKEAVQINVKLQIVQRLAANVQIMCRHYDNLLGARYNDYKHNEEKNYTYYRNAMSEMSIRIEEDVGIARILATDFDFEE